MKDSDSYQERAVAERAQKVKCFLCGGKLEWDKLPDDLCDDCDLKAMLLERQVNSVMQQKITRL